MISEEPEIIKAPEVTEVMEVKGVTKVSDVPKAADIHEVIEVPVITEALDVLEDPEITKVVKIGMGESESSVENVEEDDNGGSRASEEVSRWKLEFNPGPVLAMGPALPRHPKCDGTPRLGMYSKDHFRELDDGM